VGSEDLLAGTSANTMWEREFQILGKELLDVWTTDIGGLLDLNDLEDVDRPEASAVTGGHVLVECVHGFSSRHLTVLLVHVVGAGARVVSNPDTEVLDLLGALLVDLVQRNDLAVRLLDLSQPSEEVPESRLGDDGVGSKDTHPVQLRGRVGLAGQMAPNDLVFLETTHLD